MSVTYPRGFLASGISAGLKPSGRRDLGLLVAGDGCAIAGLFTTNVFAAPPVQLSRSQIADGAPRAVLVNSGQANAATGERGVLDARVATAAVAEVLGLEPSDVLPCSTGVIGEPLHMPELLGAVPELVASLGGGGGRAFAESIMTTDTVVKQAAADAGPHRVGGCAKGVGMISPNLATMLVFITTDARVDGADLHLLAEAELAPRFNSLTVDACTSTNDTVLLFANGAAGGDPVRPGMPAWERLSAGIGEVGESLLGQLVADAEGVTHVLLVEIVGARSEGDARTVAKAVADSPLVKTAAFGADPNPGRILQAVGSSGVAMDPSRVRVAIGDTDVVAAGVIPPAYFGDGGELHDAAQAAMKEPEIRITVDLGAGPASSRALGCDLSYEYVRINGEYTT